MDETGLKFLKIGKQIKIYDQKVMMFNRKALTNTEIQQYLQNKLPNHLKHEYRNKKLVTKHWFIVYYWIIDLPEQFKHYNPQYWLPVKQNRNKKEKESFIMTQQGLKSI